MSFDKRKWKWVVENEIFPVPTLLLRSWAAACGSLFCSPSLLLHLGFLIGSSRGYLRESSRVRLLSPGVFLLFCLARYVKESPLFEHNSCLVSRFSEPIHLWTFSSLTVRRAVMCNKGNTKLLEVSLPLLSTASMDTELLELSFRDHCSLCL